jgi:hypothetical protein
MTLPVVFTANGPSGYNLTNSLRFRASATANLQRTPATTTSQTTWTWSGWVKRGSLGTVQYLFGTYPASGQSNSTWIEFGFYANDILAVGGWTTSYRQTTQVFRDISAWYHIVLAIDSNQATASNRVRLYVNGTEITAFTTNNNPSSGQTMGGVNSTVVHCIGNSYPLAGTNPFDGYIAENYFIDGQQLTPSSFGSTNALTGVWQPAKYTGTYGTNGFYLPFTDNSALTTSSNVGLGKDFSGNANYWTTNNISITAGTTYDSMTDVPTLTSATTANYAVLNPLWKGANITPTDGNLTNPLNNGSPNVALSTMPMSTGKWYAEMTNTASYGDVGLCIVAANLTAPTFTIGATTQTGLWEVYDNGGGIYVTSDGGAFSSSLGSTRFRPAGTIQFAYDATNGYFWIGRNNTWYDSSFGTTGDPATGANPTFTISSSRAPFNIGAGSNSATNAQYWNFGQQPFTYTPPTGFVRLNTFNLTTPTIGATASTTANKYMNIALYTGTGSSLSVTGVGFQPDWTWIKGRSGATDHGLYDAVRGVQKQLESNTTTAETTETTGLTAFGSDGFTVGALAQLNTSSATYVGWNWKANGAGSSNTAGTITSTVSANTTAGFSIVTYTGNGTSSQTCGHGLGVTPSMVIWKNRNDVDAWIVYHSALTTSEYLVLNTSAAKATVSGLFTGISSTVLPLNNASAAINANGFNYVAYCFAQIAGYSAFGSFTGNGSSDGPFIYLGFRPKFFLYKKSSSTSDWWMFDATRNTYNVVNAYLFPNLSNAEGTENWFDFTANGLKMRDRTDVNTNGNGSTYIYMAFAESPFKYANAR